MVMRGLTWKTLKQEWGLIPLFAIVGTAVTCSFAYALRLAIYNPDVAWVRKRGVLSNEVYRDKQYKFYSPNLDYKTYKCPAPRYELEDDK